MEVHGRKMEQQDSDNDESDNKKENTDGNLAGGHTSDKRTDAVSEEESDNHIEISSLFTEDDSNVEEHLSGEDVDDTASNANENRAVEKQDIFCDPCESDGEHLTAAGYCVDCNEYLCETCYKAHCRPSITRHHVLLDADKMPSVKKCETGYHTDTCKEHFGQDIEYYCKTHEAPCCSSCMELTHGYCENTEHLTSVLNEYSNSNEVFTAIESLKSTTIHAKRIKTQIRMNHHAVNMYQDKAMSDISKCRSEVDKVFDKLENDVGSEVEYKAHIDTAQFTALEKKVDSVVFDLQTLDVHIKHLKTKPKDVYQLFLSVPNAKKKILECANELQCIERKNEVSRYVFKASEYLPTQGKSTLYFGRLETIKSERKIISECKQIINVTCHNDVNASTISGMILLPSNLLVCIDEANSALILIHMSEGIIMARKMFESAPGDVTKVNDRTVAVLLAENDKIVLVNISKDEMLETEKEICIGIKCDAIYCIEEENRLAVLFDNEIQFIDFDGNVSRSLELDMIASEKCRTAKLIVCEENGTIIVQDTSAIHMFDCEGKRFSNQSLGTEVQQRLGMSIDKRFSNQSLGTEVQQRLGMSIDGAGTLYFFKKSWNGYDITATRNVLSSRSSYMYGKTLTTIQEEPLSIFYCTRSCRLLIATKQGIKVFLCCVF